MSLLLSNVKVSPRSAGSRCPSRSDVTHMRRHALHARATCPAEGYSLMCPTGRIWAVCAVRAGRGLALARHGRCWGNPGTSDWGRAMNNEPMNHLDDWEESVMARYPERASVPVGDSDKTDAEFRDYSDTVRPEIREFYRL